MFEWMKSFRQNVAVATAEIKGKRDRLEELRIRKEDLQAAPLCKSDLLCILVSFVDEESAKYPAALGKQLALHYRSSAPHRVPPDQSIVSLLGVLRDGAGRDSAQTIQKNLFWFFGKEIKEGLRRAIEVMPETDGAGPPLADRRAETAKIDAEIEKLETDLRELDQFVKEIAGSVKV